MPYTYWLGGFSKKCNFLFQFHFSYEKEAEREAIRRIAELDAIDAAEAENAANSGSDDE